MIQCRHRRHIGEMGAATIVLCDSHSTSQISNKLNVFAWLMWSPIAHAHRPRNRHSNVSRQWRTNRYTAVGGSRNFLFFPFSVSILLRKVDVERSSFLYQVQCRICSGRICLRLSVQYPVRATSYVVHSGLYPNTALMLLLLVHGAHTRDDVGT